MNQDAFIAKYQSRWQNFEEWLDSFSKKIPEEKRPVFHNTVDIPYLYRQICQHLSLAQSRHYSAHLIDYLNQLVLRGHQHFYQFKGNSRSGFLNFIYYEFPQLIRTRWKLFWFVALLFYAPLIGIGLAIQLAPELVYSVLPPEQVSQYSSMYDPAGEYIGRHRDSDDDFRMFGFYIEHNISIGFQTFAGGMLFGLGTLFYLLYNGLVIGAVAGHLTEIGFTKTFFSFAIGHGSFELTAIVISGMAGLNLGAALLRPGQLSRMASLKKASNSSMKMVYGVILMLVIAAFIEAFWSSKRAIDPIAKFQVGAALWAFVAVYFLFAGRRCRLKK
ncbi:MAG: stage II sporulation protein M [Methylococcales bacterium]